MYPERLKAIGSDSPSIGHVIFDLDGTLVDSCAVCVDILSEILIERGSTRSIDPIEARAYMSRGGLDMVSGLLGDACSDPEADLADFRARYKLRRTPVDTLFPGVSEGLAQLCASRADLVDLLEQTTVAMRKGTGGYRLSGSFAFVVGGQSGLRPKPAPDLLHALLGCLDHPPEACLFVGDSELDHAVAVAAELPFYFMTYGYAEPGWTLEQGHAFDCFRTMTAAILSRTSATNLV